MRHQIPAAGTITAALLLTACGVFIQKVEHYQSDAVLGSAFDSIAVIAGVDDQGILQMARRVRERIEEKGVDIVHVRGLWPTELDAVEGICEQYKVQGVVVVVWNRMTLRECEQLTVAFDTQGGYSGDQRMTDRLLRYLRPGA